MKRILLMTALVVLLPGTHHADARQDARHDASILTKKDRERNSIFFLRNAGKRPIVVQVESEKVCTRESNERRPQIATYWVDPGESARLGKQLARSECRRSFRVVQASYQ